MNSDFPLKDRHKGEEIISLFSLFVLKDLMFD